jgi:hypothetical protein
MVARVVKNLTKAAAVLSLLIMSQNNAVLADSGDDEIRVCAAVYPCDNEGNVLPEFLRANDPCSEVYAQQCAIMQAKRNQTAQLSCTNKNAKLERKISYLRGQLRAMKARADRLKRAQGR